MRERRSILSCSAGRARTLLIAWWVLLFAAMHTPKPSGISPPFRLFDKCVHLGGYGVLAGLCAWWAHARGRPLDGRRYWMWFMVFAGYGVADELLQPLVNRTCDYRDWLTDMIGVALGFLAFYWMAGRNRTVG
ncbi:MAG: VanZ family protein [Phycisphaerales bacterium]|nr:VanZ family protein [Phycisphaerales bacterium]